VRRFSIRGTYRLMMLFETSQEMPYQGEQAEVASVAFHPCETRIGNEFAMVVNTSCCCTGGWHAMKLH